MTDIGPSMFNWIANVILAAILTFVVPGFFWLAARKGVAMPRWLLYTAKTLTVVGALALFVIFLGFVALANK